jgi:hypothetical protein
MSQSIDQLLFRFLCNSGTSYITAGDYGDLGVYGTIHTNVVVADAYFVWISLFGVTWMEINVAVEIYYRYSDERTRLVDLTHAWSLMQSREAEEGHHYHQKIHDCCLHCRGCFLLSVLDVSM